MFGKSKSEDKPKENNVSTSYPDQPIETPEGQNPDPSMPPGWKVEY